MIYYQFQANSEKTKELEITLEEIARQLDSLNVQSMCLKNINRVYCERFLKNS